MSQVPAPVFRQAVRVYWEDTDAGGIVFYANYLKFFERARTEWLRTKGYSQEQLRTERGTGFIVTDASISYRRPARLDDLLDITVALTRVGDDEAGAALGPQLLLRIALGAQPFGAGALEELQEVRVEDDAGGVGVFPIDTKRHPEHGCRGQGHRARIDRQRRASRAAATSTGRRSAAVLSSTPLTYL